MPAAHPTEPSHPTTASRPTAVRVHREDGELIGVLQQQGDLWLPCTVFGSPLGTPGSRASAEAALHAHGLSYLADRWEVCESGTWIAVSIVEAGPNEVTVSYADYGHPELFNTRKTLVGPTPEQLRRR